MSDAWLRAALCQRFAALPWLEEEAAVTAAQAEAMRTVCDACPVLKECETHVKRHRITGGFWAGTFRTTADHSSGIRGAA